MKALAGPVPRVLTQSERFAQAARGSTLLRDLGTAPSVVPSTDGLILQAKLNALAAFSEGIPILPQSAKASAPSASTDGDSGGFPLLAQTAKAAGASARPAFRLAPVAKAHVAKAMPLTLKRKADDSGGGDAMPGHTL